VLEHSRHDETDERGVEAAAEAFGFVVVIEALEFNVELGGELRPDGSRRGAWLELDPPLVATAVSAGGGIDEERSDVEVDDGPAVTAADGGEGVGEVLSR